MADNNILPKAQSQVVDATGKPTRAFYDFFRALVNRVQAQIDGLAAAINTLAKVVASLGGDPDDLPDIGAELDAKADKTTEVRGRHSVAGGGALGSDVYVWLEGDIETPTVMSFYGVLDATAGRGWNLISDNFAAIDNGDDTYTLDLADLADSGTGTLLAITRDAKGRINGTRDATITGTDDRVTVAHGDASDGLPTIDLATVANAGGGALLRIVRDAWGRITGTSAATTSDLSEGTNLYYTDTRADARITAQKGVANGLAPLGGDAKINVSYLPAAVLGQVSYQGTWDASAGPPPTATPEKGWYYIVTVAGDTDLDGIDEWDVGDWAIYSGAAWDKVDNTDAIASWNGRTGAVLPASGDYTKAQVGLGNVNNTSDADKPVSTTQQMALDLKQNSAALGTAAFTDTGNNASGLVPVLNSPSPGQTSLTLVGPSARANIAMQSGNADAADNGEGTVTVAGTGSVSASTEKRLGIFAFNTSGGTAGHRGGKFAINLKQNGSTSIVSRFTVEYDGRVQPGFDNTQTMGTSLLRWSVFYAGTGTINTSDAREKTAVVPLTAAELAATADLSRAIGTYQWLAMVAEKGADAARHHSGLTVQRAIEIMQSRGLDPMRYGFICYDQWGATPEVCDPETGEVTQEYRPAGDRYSFRTDELMLFIARGVDARLSAIEAKLS